ncbi:hypothetical protein Ciccas_008254, partial [Cichlidogyrus casuarinus]
LYSSDEESKQEQRFADAHHNRAMSILGTNNFLQVSNARARKISGGSSCSSIYEENIKLEVTESELEEFEQKNRDIEVEDPDFRARIVPNSEVLQHRYAAPATSASSAKRAAPSSRERQLNDRLFLADFLIGIESSRVGDLREVHNALNQGADLLAVNSLGRSALHCAAKAGHVEIVKLLISFGSATLLELRDLSNFSLLFTELKRHCTKQQHIDDDKFVNYSLRLVLALLFQTLMASAHGNLLWLFMTKNSLITFK